MNPAERGLAAGASERTATATSWLLGAALVLAALLRVRESLGTPLWFDELYIMTVARQSLPDVLRTVARDIHPPLPFVLRWAWMRIGEGELWVRSMSILLALASLMMTFRLGRRMFGAGAAMIAVLLLVINPTHIHYSKEVEDYTLTWLAVMGFVDGAWRWIENRRGRDALAFCAWSAIALYTHYVALFLLATLFVWGLAMLRHERRALGAWIGLNAAAFAVFIPQALIFVRQFQREGAGRYFHFPTGAAILEVWRHMSFNSTYLVVPLLGLSLLPLLRREQRKAASLLWILSTLPLLSTRLWVVILPREVLYILSLWFLLLAAGISRLPGRWTAPALTAVLLALGVRAYMRHPPFNEAVSLQHAVELVKPRIATGDLVIHAETRSFFFFRYHLPGVRNRILVPAGETVPFYEGGLVVPESLYITPEQWSRDRAQGLRWWGLRVDRALITRGSATRAGIAGATAMLTVCDSTWSFPPVTLFEGH